MASRISAVANLGIEAAINQACAAIKVSEEVDAGFLYFAFVHRYEDIRDLGHGANQRNLNMMILRAVHMPLPPPAEQQAIAHVLLTVQRAKETTEWVVAAARQLKQGLMRHLFTYGPAPFDQADRIPLRDSEVGPVPADWRIARLGDLIAEGPQNGIYKPESSYGRGTPIVRINDFGNDGDIVDRVPNRVELSEPETRGYGLKQGDITLNRVNSPSHLGKAALIGRLEEATVYESNMMRFRLSQAGVRTEYVFRWLASPASRRQLVGAAKRAVAQSSINQGDVKSVLVPLPDVAVQSRISDVLETVEQKLRSEEVRKSALSELFRALLHNLMTGKVRVPSAAAVGPPG
jgi:type I restriction enzyme S subunit